MKRYRPAVYLLLLICSVGIASLFPGCSRKPVEPLWDLPALIGQPVVVAQKTLGEPHSQAPVAPGIAKSLWNRDGVTLSATWKTGNGRVTAYELISRDDSRALREDRVAELLIPGQLKTQDPRYTTEWIEASSRPLFYTGVKVVPAPRNYAVILRVTGSEDLIQVAYEVTTSGGQSDNLLTIAPWENSFTVSDDGKVTLSAQLYKSLSKKPVEVKLEIIADGKVVSSAVSTGPPVSCNYEF